ncbi:MAG: hypothetical protein Sylvanvirus14_9 [Sylvanvirus sp.]|uniref:Uncharacterized protein n=1 Tax=Sylvanvirus sp. TaxID=2487774 RepID=A0A3G5AJK5_9VIRU|nr:MAG: hypothetical protein Sylvanvirus14_9 [Sylvanvirus sp.]
MDDLKNLKDFNIFKDMNETKNKTRMISTRISTRPSSRILERSQWLWINITSFIWISEMRGVASMSRSINRLLQHPHCWSSSMNDYLFISGDNIYFFDTPLGIVNNSSCSLMLHRHLHISSFLSNRLLKPLLLQFVGDCKRVQSLKCNLDTFFQLISCESISSICITSLYLTNLAEEHVYDQTELELLDTWGLKIPYVRHLICQFSTSELKVATHVIRGIQYLRGIYSIHMIGDSGYGYEVDVEDEHVGHEWTSVIQDVSRYAPCIFELRLDKMTKGPQLLFNEICARFLDLFVISYGSVCTQVDPLLGEYFRFHVQNDLETCNYVSNMLVLKSDSPVYDLLEKQDSSLFLNKQIYTQVDFIRRMQLRKLWIVGTLSSRGRHQIWLILIALCNLAQILGTSALLGSESAWIILSACRNTNQLTFDRNEFITKLTTCIKPGIENETTHSTLELIIHTFFKTEIKVLLTILFHDWIYDVLSEVKKILSKELEFPNGLDDMILEFYL